MSNKQPFISQTFINAALAEDLGRGDHTSLACIPRDAKGEARLLVKESGIICGVDLALRIFKTLDRNLKVHVLIKDGQRVQKGDIVLTVSGRIIPILSAERLVLNCMQRMSGIATKTAAIVKLLEGTQVRVLDTRKTTPGLRALEKQAVKTGGGVNHRFGLYDMILIKDNHIDFCGGIPQAIASAKSYLKKNKMRLKIVVEARTISEVRQVLEAGGTERILLDNFTVSGLKQAVKLIAGRLKTEASGGITEKNIRKYASTGVDYISMGALTHSVKSLDLSLKAHRTK